MAITVYVGIDDSNHAGTAKGEIIAAVFSFMLDDKVVKKWPNKRQAGIEKIMQGEQRDYRFTILTGKEYRHKYSNLPIAAPLLVRSFLKDFISVSNIRLDLDGVLRAEDKKRLRDELSDASSVVVNNYVKKYRNGNGEIVKRHCCPVAVYYADSLANYLMHEPLERLLRNERFVPFVEERDKY